MFSVSEVYLHDLVATGFLELCHLNFNVVQWRERNEINTYLSSKTEVAPVLRKIPIDYSFQESDPIANDWFID